MLCRIKLVSTGKPLHKGSLTKQGRIIAIVNDKIDNFYNCFKTEKGWFWKKYFEEIEIVIKAECGDILCNDELDYLINQNTVNIDEISIVAVHSFYSSNAGYGFIASPTKGAKKSPLYNKKEMSQKLLNN